MCARVTTTLVALLLTTSLALAQEHDPASAEVLFSQGRKAFDKGDYATACEKFEESQRLDPAAGTLINLAACHERLGRLASAWEKWREALRYLPASDERHPSVAKRAEALESRLPRLEVQLAADSPEGTRVTRDGVPLGAPSLGVGMPVDPGRHVIVVSAPGHEERKYTVWVEESKTAGVVVQPGDLLPAAPMGETAPHDATPSPAPIAADPPRRPASSARKTIGFLLAGVGAAGIAGGAVFGALTLDRKGTVLDNCQETGDALLCNADGLDAADEGKRFATVSTVGFAVGAVALGVGAYLVLGADDGGATAVVMRPLLRGGGLSLARSF
jgi:hypothetical protein